jgi:hypothetical protein
VFLITILKGKEKQQQNPVENKNYHRLLDSFVQSKNDDRYAFRKKWSLP